MDEQIWELTYTSVEDGGKTYLVEMYVNGEKYSVDIGFPEGTHQMLPGETLVDSDSRVS